MLVYMRDSAAPGRDVSEGKAALGLSGYGSVPRGVYGSVGDLSIPVKRTPKPPPPKKPDETRGIPGKMSDLG